MAKQHDPPAVECIKHGYCLQPCILGTVPPTRVDACPQLDDPPEQAQSDLARRPSRPFNSNQPMPNPASLDSSLRILTGQHDHGDSPSTTHRPYVYSYPAKLTPPSPLGSLPTVIDYELDLAEIDAAQPMPVQDVLGIAPCEYSSLGAPGGGRLRSQQEGTLAQAVHGALQMYQGDPRPSKQQEHWNVGLYGEFQTDSLDGRMHLPYAHVNTFAAPHAQVDGAGSSWRRAAPAGSISKNGHLVDHFFPAASDCPTQPGLNAPPPWDAYCAHTPQAGMKAGSPCSSWVAQTATENGSHMFSICAPVARCSSFSLAEDPHWLETGSFGLDPSDLDDGAMVLDTFEE